MADTSLEVVSTKQKKPRASSKKSVAKTVLIKEETPLEQEASATLGEQTSATLAGETSSGLGEQTSATLAGETSSRLGEQTSATLGEQTSATLGEQTSATLGDVDKQEPIEEKTTSKKPRTKRSKDIAAKTELSNNTTETSDVCNTDNKAKPKRTKKITKKDKNTLDKENEKDASKDSDNTDERDREERSENVILQLNITADAISTFQTDSNNFEKNFYNYEPNIVIPDAYDKFDCNEFSSQPCEVKIEDEVPSSNPQPVNAPVVLKRKKAEKISGKKVFDHLNEFVVRDEWPISTDISCFWCCHSFTNSPVGIPTKYTHAKFHVIGCFCSLECAMAYNFYSNELKHDVWESFSLLNMLSRKLQYRDMVKMAPPRHALKMFGGYMDINEFRAYSDTNKVMSTHTYPMVAVIQQLEEVNDMDSFNYGQRKNLFVPVDKQKLFMLENKMKLERTKPLHQNKNTLDHTMNLKVNG